ncbi:DoxX family protein [Mesorhizobium sp. YM1C-6-2]|uniref:DoxX family protein n=1 Tax=Mesorhizobium sp. YM1C-6-2 TaxID=1827501 RepID=UPI000EF1B403|nr:DoxX family protein [Mesorhizobium sp. YM1C-6-2]RLP22340.1 DoxX family protein [Mesorhizobium sp. YM1C-6-2]
MSTSATAGQAGTSGASVAILIGRILLAAMFVLAGFGKLTDIGGTAGWFGSIGLPAPTIVAVLVGLLELVAGLAIVVGFQTRIAALALALFTIGATLIAHTNFADMMQFLIFQKNFAVVGGLLVLAFAGAGALSVDARRG